LLKECNDIFVAIGYRSKQIKKKVKTVHFVFNPFYKYTNSIVSLWFVLDKIDKADDLIILNGDAIFEQGLITRFIKSEINQITMLIDSSIPYEKSDFKLYVSKGHVKKMGKNLERDNYSGEYAQIVRVPKSKFNSFKSTIEKMIYDENFDVWYELAIRNARVIDVEGKYWIEIDNKMDLENVEIDRL